MAERRATLNTLLGLGVCTDPAEADKCMGWARELWDAMQPCATGDVYVNYRGQEAEEGGSNG
ncbi:MAG TPA: hypothetical protein VLK82_28355 [Candidatus Tectomicrobia bacterium]|nr:hypothetical protein [Candidatus Tectomicrobia bacterium]